MTITIQSDHISLHDIVFPPIRIRVCPESLLQLKNIDYERLLVKNFVWYSSLIDELQFVMMDCSTGDEKSDQSLLQDVNQLILRAENERNEIATMVHKVYSDSHPTDTLALNAVRRYRQDRMVAWQQDFDRLPKPRPPAVTEKEKRPTTTFGTVRNMFPKRSELLNLFETPNRDSRESDTESFTFRGRRIVSEPGASASESESATDSAQMKSAKPATKLPEEEKEEEKEIEVTGLAAEVAELPPVEESTRSEGEDSDDTIGASKASLRRESGTDLVSECSARALAC
jgi:1-phosphatidylinositol-3-phosphate 5-kinase